MSEFNEKPVMTMSFAGLPLIFTRVSATELELRRGDGETWIRLVDVHPWSLPIVDGSRGECEYCEGGVPFCKPHNACRWGHRRYTGEWVPCPNRPEILGEPA